MSHCSLSPLVQDRAYGRGRSPLPSGAGVLLFQCLPRPHLVLSPGCGLSVCLLMVLLCSRSPGPELKHTGQSPTVSDLGCEPLPSLQNYVNS